MPSIADDLPSGQLLFHDLFRRSKPLRLIVWLRLFRLPRERHLAFVTEVPGNPDPGRGATFFRSLVAREFSVDQASLDLVVIWPKRQVDGRIVDAAWYGLPSNSSFNLQNLDRVTIRAAVALLPPLPDHSQLLAKVLKLGGERRDLKSDGWEVVDVASLPPPHLPFKCHHKERFEKMVGSGRTIEAHLLAGRRFLESLTDHDLKQCPYHKADWDTIADASAEIIELNRRGDASDFIAQANRRRLPARDKRCLVDLFDEPIVLRKDRTKYVNGQHRGCAVRFSGAARVAVVIEGAITNEDPAAWVYLGES
jgi:hypothetical protein